MSGFTINYKSKLLIWTNSYLSWIRSIHNTHDTTTVLLITAHYGYKATDSIKILWLCFLKGSFLQLSHTQSIQNAVICFAH